MSVSKKDIDAITLAANYNNCSEALVDDGAEKIAENLRTLIDDDTMDPDNLGLVFEKGRLKMFFGQRLLGIEEFVEPRVLRQAMYGPAIGFGGE